ncbi:MAG: hypothetical protein K0R65_681 [Crocinitomicaceae bacterium]|jgi:hypothetical protein|nr:hypothetical protein [Crocinitomicaceae bacterium]
MKKKILSLGLLTVMNFNLNAQFTLNGTNYGETVATMRGIGIGNFSSNGATATNARFHINNFYCNQPNGPLNGLLFRSDGNNSVANTWDMFTGSNANNVTAKFRISVLSTAGNEEVRLGTVHNKNMHFMTANLNRVTILRGGGPLAQRPGYIGFNNENPNFHLDIMTPERNNGELLLRTRVTGDTNAYMANINLAGVTSTQYIPAWMGKQSAINPNTAFNTIGSIENAQDVASAITISRFISARDYDPNVGDFTLGRVNVVTNRPIFQWVNGVDGLMVMEASGFLGLATANPGNRLEINSDFYGAAGVPLTPAQQRHFNTNNGNPGLGGGNATGFSGLRLTDMRSGSVPLAVNPGLGVLSVDANGDVIYVPAGGGGGGTVEANNGLSINSLTNHVVLGQNVGDITNPAILLNDREIPMNGEQLNFNNGFVNVNSLTGENELAGLNVRPANTALVAHPYTTEAKNRSLNVINTNGLLPVGIEVYTEGAAIETIGVNSNAKASSAGAVLGVRGIANSDVVNGTCVGVDGVAFGNNASRIEGINVAGLRGFASNGSGSTWGLLADAIGTSITAFGVQGRSAATATSSFGVNGAATGAAVTNYGVYGLASGGTTNNYGVFGTASGTGSYAGYFVGPVNVQGSLTVFSNPVLVSDQMFKANVDNIENALDLIGQLQPRTYIYDTVTYPEFGFESDAQMGLIAQEVELVLPALVNERNRPAQYDSQGNIIQAELKFKGVEYEELIPLLIAGMKEQQSEIEDKDSVIANQQSQLNDLNSRLSQLENCLSALLPTLCEANQMAVQQTPQEIQRELSSKLQVKLSDKNTLVLSQNVPNPFAESTVIAYSIPTTVKQAQMHFYNMQGKLIQSVEISERGNGELTVFADDLSSGQYSYNLVADGKIVATKKMVKL